MQVGDTLAKGTVIAELDEGDLRRAKASAEARVAQLEARVATARDNLEIAQRNYQRYANSAGAVSEAARDDAELPPRHGGRRTGNRGARAGGRAASSSTRPTTTTSTGSLIVPFDHATVAEKHIEPGERKLRTRLPSA